MNDVTRILADIEKGDQQAAGKLLPLVYDELRRLAARELSNDGAGDSLQATVLVHEAYIRLVDQVNEPKWDHRGHFYSAAARSMRRILVEHARRKKSLKRGGDRQQVALELADSANPARSPDLLALDEALDKLAEERPEIANLVSLRYFAGLSMSQAAKAMGISQRSAERHWTYAKGWLVAEIKSSD